jgi:pimeloyl-ACP methyl ester carboxylesterase
MAERLKNHGVDLHVPDLNQPDFSTLTITRMVRQISDVIDALPSGPIALIGSSLGGFVAAQVAVVRPTRIGRLVLLAPALDFGANRMRNLGGIGLAEWKRRNRLDVFHYGYGRMIGVHYELYEDARRYDSLNAVLTMPIQVFQGRRDDAVDPVTVERWARARPNAELHMLDDDHQLGGSLEYIWTAMRGFLGL